MAAAAASMTTRCNHGHARAAALTTTATADAGTDVTVRAPQSIAMPCSSPPLKRPDTRPPFRALFTATEAAEQQTSSTEQRQQTSQQERRQQTPKKSEKGKKQATIVNKTPQVMVWVGLGNPGKEYANTRHNMGFMVLDAVAEAKGLSWQRNRKCKAMVATFTDHTNNTEVHMLKPQTFMNLSGDAVQLYLKQVKASGLAHGAKKAAKQLPANAVFAVCDDLDQPLGRMKMKPKGSSGGHNGLRSMEKRLASKEYPRLRVGVWPQHLPRDAARHVVTDLVLTSFQRQEQPVVAAVVKAARDALLSLCREQNLDKCMTSINSKPGLFQAGEQT